MTCQNASLLEELVKEEVFFCEKDSKGRTTIYGLRDVQAVRRNDNYYRKYLGGLSGAMPVTMTPANCTPAAPTGLFGLRR